MGIAPGSACMFWQKIFSVWPKIPAGEPPSEYRLIRWASGWEAIFDSSATRWARLWLLAIWGAARPEDNRPAKRGHESPIGIDWGLWPSNWTIALAAVPLAGPGTKKLAPLSGSGPGDAGRP